MSRSEHVSLLKRTSQPASLFFPFFCFHLSQKGMIRQSKKKEEKSSKGWQERYDHLSISFLNIKVGKTEMGDAGHHSVMLTCDFLGNSEFIHWTVKKQCLLHRPGGDWCPCGLCFHPAMEYMTAAVWPQWRCRLFPGSQMLTGMLSIYLRSLHSAQAKHAWISVCQYTFHTLWFLLFV